MPNREEALRKIFEATGVSARLTEDQKRELLAHVEDAVEAKIGAGVPEMEAVGLAFSELGDLEKIAGQFPKAPPTAVTPEGVRVAADGKPLLASAFCFFLLFVFLGFTISPKVVEVFAKVRVPLPGLTLLFLSLSTSIPVLAGMVLLMVGSLTVVRRRNFRVPQALGHLLLIGSVTLCVGLVVSYFLPLVSLLEGIGQRRH